MQKPSVKDIIDWKEQLKSFYSQMHKNMKKCAEAYRLNFDVERPDDVPAYMPATAPIKVEKGVKRLVTNRPSVNVEASDTTEIAQRNQDVTQKFFEYGLEQFSLDSDAAPIKECAKNLCLYGAACLKTLYTPKRWGDPPKKKDKEPPEQYKRRKQLNFPIVQRAVNPLVVMPAPNGDFYIEYYSRLAMDIKSSWPEWDMRNKYGALLKPFDKVEWVEFWSDEWRCFLIDDKSILESEVQPNIYGLPPYTWRYSGWGDSSEKGRPEDKAIGLLNRVLSTLKAEARLKTAMDAQLRYHIYGRLYSSVPLKDMDLHTHPGGMSYIPQGHELHEFPQAHINPEAYGLLGQVERDLNEATFSTSDYRATTSGYDNALNKAEDRLAFDEPRSALEKMLAVSLKQAAHLVKYVIDEPVPISGKIEIKPENIIEPLNVKVHLEPIDPEENDRRQRLGREMHQAGLISARTAREDYLKVSDAEERRRVLVEAMLNDPSIKAVLAKATAEQWGLGRLLAEMQEKGKISPEAGREILEEQQGLPEQLEMRKLQQMGAPGETAPMRTAAERGELFPGKGVR